MLFSLVTVILAAPLLINVLEKNRVGQIRPATYPVSSVVRKAVREYISHAPNLQVIMMARDSVEPDTGIFLTLAAAGPLRPGVKDDLVQVIRTARGDANAHVRIFTLLEASTAEP